MTAYSITSTSCWVNWSESSGFCRYASSSTGWAFWARVTIDTTMTTTASPVKNQVRMQAASSAGGRWLMVCGRYGPPYAEVGGGVHAVGGGHCWLIGGGCSRAGGGAS